MNPIEIIDKFYPQETEQRHILLIHSLSVAQKALKIVDAHPNLPINRSFVREAALLHDIGIFLTDAPTIQCFGEHPYIAHGYLGADLLRKEGFERHALVCERHTGARLCTFATSSVKLLVNGAIESKNNYIIHIADCLADAS